MSEFFNEIIGGKGSGNSGGTSIKLWNPLATQGQPKYQDIQAGIKKSGVFSIVDFATQDNIDQVPIGTINSTIIFDEEPNKGWRIIGSKVSQSKETNPSTVANETILNSTFPPAEQYSGYYCYVSSTSTYWQCTLIGTNFAWYNTAQKTIDTFSRDEINNLLQSNSIFDINRANHTGTQLASTISDFTESAQDAIGNTLLDTATIDLTYEDATNKISADVKDLSITNSKIATNADIATSKIKQNTVSPADFIIANGMSQESINNGLQGQVSATRTLANMKVDKVAGQGLSDNNFTNAYKATLDNLTEVVQDDVNALLIDSSTIVKTYDDNAGTLSLAVKTISIDNTHISNAAGIETSKAKQSVITPILATPTNNDTQDVINNKSLGLINNLQSQIDTRPIGASNGSVYYLTSQSSAIANYELLSFSPDPSALDIESVTINSTTAKASRLIHSYIANYDIGSAIINGGNWLFNFYGYVSHLNSSRFEIDIVKRAGATETLLFTCETTDFLQIAQVSPELNIVNVETTQQDFACNTTDKIVIKVYGKTNRTQDTTITLLHSGTEYASHIHTPLIVSHNNLVGTQGGTATEKYHLSLADYNKVLVLDASLALKENSANKTSTFSVTPDDNKFPTEKLVKDSLNLKVDTVANKSLILDTEITRLATMQTGSQKNVQANWSETNNTLDSFILNKPTLGTVASKNVGTAIGNIQENGAILGNLQNIETDSTGRFITTVKGTAHNQNYSTAVGDIKANGIGSLGSLSTLPRADHIHPTDETRENVANKVSAFTATPNDINYITEKLAKDSLNLKQNITDNTLNTVAKTIVGAINEIQTNTYTKTEVNNIVVLKADINSPTFTGVPKAPTALAGTNDTQIATTNFVKTEISETIASLTTLSSLVLPLSQTTGTLPIAKGGTNSATALANNKVMGSSNGAIVETEITTTQLATLGTGTTLAKFAATSVPAVGGGKTLPYGQSDGSIAWETPAIGGNVSGSGSSVIGQPAIFGDTTRTTIISPTNTAAQRQIYSKAQNIIVSYTTAERNSLSWSSGDIILNSTTLLLEQYNGTTWYTVYQDNSDFVNWIENGVNGGGTLAGSAYWQTNSSVSLKNCVTFTNVYSTFQTGVWYKNIPQVAQYKRIVLQADHVAGGGTGADGIWYSLFANSTSYSNKELTQNNSYTVYFDEFNNTVKLYYNGTLLQSTNINNLQTGIGQSKQIKFIVDYNYLTNTSIIFVNIIGSDIGTGACIQYTDSTQRDLSGQYVLVGGRTGESTNFHEIHYLSIRKFYGY